MKKSILFLLLCLLASLHLALAETITPDFALRVGLKFLSENSHREDCQSSPIAESIQLENVQDLASVGFPALYLVQSANGWVILPNDTRIRPILAYSAVGTFDIADIPDGLRDLLLEYNNEIRYVIDSCIYSQELPNDTQWQQILGGQVAIGGDSVSVPYRDKILWGQSSNNDKSCYPSYNQLCPTFHNVGCERNVVGCGAVALAQVLWYYKWPLYAYVPNTISPLGIPSKETHFQLYDWDLMPPTLHNTTLEEKANMIATLLRDCGYSIRTKYGSEGSTSNLTNTVKALKEVWGYSSNAKLFQKASTSNWTQKLKTEIDEGRPIIYRGQGPEGGHAFVIDGYKGDMFHINWGWASTRTSGPYFFLNSLQPKPQNDENVTFNSLQAAIFGITPTIPSSIVIRGGEEIMDEIFVACNQVTLEDYVFPANLNGYFYSGTQVRLKPGCWLKRGSNVHIAIKDIPCNNRNSSVQAAPVLRSSDNAGSVVPIPLPNQQSDKVAIAETEQIVFSVLYSVSGQLVQTIQGNEMNLQTLPQGFYILQKHTDRGNVLVEKVAVN